VASVTAALTRRNGRLILSRQRAMSDF